MAESKNEKSPRERLFTTAPTAIVIYEMQPFAEPIIVKHPETGVRRINGENTGEALHVRGEMAHIEGQLAYPLDGGDPLLYGPGKPGCWGRKVHGK